LSLIEEFKGTSMHKFNVINKKDQFDVELILEVENSATLSGIIEKLNRLKGIEKAFKVS